MAEKDIEFVRIIKEMQQRGFDIFLVVNAEEATDAYPLEVRSSCTAWLWEDLLEEESPISITFGEHGFFEVSEVERPFKRRKLWGEDGGNLT